MELPSVSLDEAQVSACLKENSFTLMWMEVYTLSEDMLDENNESVLLRQKNAEAIKRPTFCCYNINIKQKQN